MGDVVDAVTADLHDEVVEAARRSVTAIRSTWPRDTGTSGDAFRALERPWGALVECPVRYAGYVHDGASERQAQATAAAEVDEALDRFAGRHR